MRSVSSVRARTTLAATVVVGLALVCAGVALVLVMRSALTESVQDSAELNAAEVAAALRGGADAATVTTSTDDVFIQLVQPGDDAAAPPFDDRFLAATVTSDSPDGQIDVVVSRSLDDVDEAVRIVSLSLLFGIPALLLIVAFTTWRVVGRALRPVDAVRREVEEISSSQLHRRVPLPPGDDEVHRLATTMNCMLDRLEESQRRQRRFISDASHELRSPVATIRQHAELALAHPDRSDLNDLATTVLAEDLRLQQLVDDLLLLARADEHVLPLSAAEVDLDDIVLAEAHGLRDERSIVVDTTEVSAARVIGNDVLLSRLVRNLTSNAVRHARHHISFGLSTTNGEVVLRVDDDGDGVPREQRTRVFERFVRLDEARARDVGGAGLGLAIVAEIATAHGGSALVTESPAGGARVCVILPVAADEPP